MLLAAARMRLLHAPCCNGRMYWSVKLWVAGEGVAVRLATNNMQVWRGWLCGSKDAAQQLSYSFDQSDDSAGGESAWCSVCPAVIWPSLCLACIVQPIQCAGPRTRY